VGEIIRRTKAGRFLGYYLRFYEGGRRRVLASKQLTYVDARRMLLEIEARIARGEVGLVDKPTALLLSELTERFLTSYSRPRIKDPRRYRQLARVALQRIVPLIDKRADQVTSADLTKARESLRGRYAPASVKVTLNFLGTLYSWAMSEGLLTRNPTRGVERPAVQHSVDFLSKDETRRLLEAAEAEATTPARRMLYLCILLALHTGMRKGELLGLRWTDLDLDTRRLTVARSYEAATKSGKVRHLRLPTDLQPLFAAWRRDCPKSRDGVIFPVGKNGVAEPHAMLGLPRLWKAVGLRPITHVWHCLRHTMASHFIMSGGNILALQKILGHVDFKMTLVYAHLAPDFLDGELERLKWR
jgi:integrase